MARAIDVARFLIELAAAEVEPELLTHLRLQKLLYYVQGWSLAATTEPAFDDPIVAWVHGPVVRSVGRVFEKYGGSPIPVSEGQDRLDMGTRDLVECVWNAYREHSAWALRDMTHREEGWIEARAGAAPEERTNTVISFDTMRRTFEQRYEQHAPQGMSIDLIRRAQCDIESGATVSVDALTQRLVQSGVLPSATM